MMDKSDALIDAYIDRTIDDEQFESLCNWLCEDAAHRKTFARKLAMHSAITEWCVERSGGLLADELQAAEEASARQERTWIDELADLADPTEQSAPADKPLTSRELIALIGFAFGEALTTKAAYKAFAIAAAVLLAVTLFFVFTGGDETPTHAPFASDNTPNDPSEPGRDGPDAPNPVATLTASHNAQWAQASLAPGSDLQPNQTLTLTQGSAQITTADGAIAILQAPATIQLINDNALHLHAGKLVGICETDASKGFLVRTEHLDITDLGTRFGVDSNASATEVHVYEGIVEVGHASATHASPAKPQRLIAGKALRAAANVDAFTPIQTDPKRFAAIMPTRIELPGTGQGLALNDNDPNWRVTAIDGKPLDTPGAMTVRDAHEGYEGPPFLPNDPQTSQWLIIDKRLGQSGTGPVTFTCQSRFEIPPGVDASAARLIVSFDADDSVTAVRINGQAVAVPENEFVDDSRDLHAMTIRRHMIAGQNTIEIDIMDRRSLGFANSGLRVKLSLQPN